MASRIEADLRGLNPEARLAERQERSAPLIADMHAWLVPQRVRVAAKSPLGETLAYIAKYWDALRLFLADGRIEIDNITVERTIRPCIATSDRDRSRLARSGHSAFLAAGEKARVNQTFQPSARFFAPNS